MKKHTFFWAAITWPFLIAAVIMGSPFLSLSVVQATEEIGIIREGGIRHVNAVEAAHLIRQGQDIIILDVRTPREFKQGHIEGAINIDYYSQDFKKRLGELDKTAAYLIHCKSGARSGRSLPIMKSVGIKNITHLDRGFDGWKAAGLAVSIN